MIFYVTVGGRVTREGTKDQISKTETLRAIKAEAAGEKATGHIQRERQKNEDEVRVSWASCVLKHRQVAKAKSRSNFQKHFLHMLGNWCSGP